MDNVSDMFPDCVYQNGARMYLYMFHRDHVLHHYNFSLLFNVPIIKVFDKSNIAQASSIIQSTGANLADN